VLNKRFQRRFTPLAGAALWLCLANSAVAVAVADIKAETEAESERCAVDDLEREVCLEAPASRIAALSPGATELAFAAGAGENVVAVVAHSDYPPAARQLPSVGNHNRLDLEALVGLEPDLVIGWVTGNPDEQLKTLKSLDMAVFYIEPRTTESVARALERLAHLSGSDAIGREEAERFRDGMAELKARYSEREPVSVFYQVWDAPLMSINKEHLIGRAVEDCGGVNVFGDQPRLVPRLDDEAVLQANPDVIITGRSGDADSDDKSSAWLAHWQQYPGMTAVAEGNLFTVPADWLVRPTPRFLQGAEALCERLDRARHGNEHE
jgi:iron complex transport system substrate-binding protein